MGKVELREFIPPIFYRAVNYFLRKRRDGSLKMHPFDAVPGDLNVRWILDVGANVGDVAVAALKSYANARVICFEPVGSTFEALTQKMKPFSGRSHLFNFALSDVEETGAINITTHHGANSIEHQAQFHQDCNPHVREVGKEQIRLVRLDDWAAKLPSHIIDIMKIDVEGHEINVLRGGRNFISNNVDVIIIEISLMRDPCLRSQAVFEIFKFFNEIGFCLLNVMDLHYTENKEIQLAQMDCVFRNTKMLAQSRQ